MVATRKPFGLSNLCVQLVESSDRNRNPLRTKDDKYAAVGNLRCTPKADQFYGDVPIKVLKDIAIAKQVISKANMKLFHSSLAPATEIGDCLCAVEQPNRSLWRLRGVNGQVRTTWEEHRAKLRRWFENNCVYLYCAALYLLLMAVRLIRNYFASYTLTLCNRWSFGWQ